MFCRCYRHFIIQPWVFAGFLFGCGADDGVDRSVGPADLGSTGGGVDDNGASRVIAAAVHGVLSGPAMTRIENSPIDKLVVTNTIPLKGRAGEKVVVLSVARLLAQAIRSIHEETSVSKLFV